MERISNKKIYAQEHAAQPARIIDGFGPATRDCATREEYAEFLARTHAFLAPRIRADTPEPIIIRANKLYKPHPHIKIFAISTRKHTTIEIPDAIGEFGQISVVTARRLQRITLHGGIIAEETAIVYCGTHLLRLVDFDGRDASCCAIYISDRVKATSDVWTRGEVRARELVMTREPSQQMMEKARERMGARVDVGSLSALLSRLTH